MIGRTLRLAMIGCVLVAASVTGLQRAFPPLAGGDPAPDRVELGRLLFFDPVLSADGTLSCAHCHRPDRAMADGRPRARGRNGVVLERNTPTLYNVAFKDRLMWDRRAASLEAQVRLPLFRTEELGADPERLVARLEAIPAYQDRFSAVFGEAISIDRIADAISAFERTLVSQRSRFDRYAAGDRGALTVAERRGLSLFRSLNTRCFECHRLPTFDAPLAIGIGVPSMDPGVAGAGGNPVQTGFFGVPGLRNVALTAPYMHDGSLATLDDVVDFYRKGGGRASGLSAPRVHEHIRAFDIGDDEAADLVAFLGALTDESQRPRVPNSVPSGYPVLEEDS